MAHADIPAWVARYLQRLEQPVEAPSYAYLSRLMTAHLKRFAFENISKLYYYKHVAETGWYIPPIEAYVENMHTLDVGGTCFTNNSNFVQLLQQLGFDAYLVGFSMAHMGIIVRLPEGRFYVDVGVGSPFFEPVDFEAEPKVIYCGTGIHFLQKETEPGIYHFHHYNMGNNVLQWEFAPDVPKTFDQFAESIEKQNTPGTMFMSMLRCQLWQPHKKRNVMLSNSSLTIRGEDLSETKRKLQSIEEIEAVLADVFELPRLPVREAIETLYSLGVDIFTPPQEKETEEPART
jgi:N-hydroxyarylamine O-acetyltransferase